MAVVFSGSWDHADFQVELAPRKRTIRVVGVPIEGSLGGPRVRTCSTVSIAQGFDRIRPKLSEEPSFAHRSLRLRSEVRDHRVTRVEQRGPYVDRKDVEWPASRRDIQFAKERREKHVPRSNDIEAPKLTPKVIGKVRAGWRRHGLICPRFPWTRNKTNLEGDGGDDDEGERRCEVGGRSARRRAAVEPRAQARGGAAHHAGGVDRRAFERTRGRAVAA